MLKRILFLFVFFFVKQISAQNLQWAYGFGSAGKQSRGESVTFDNLGNSIVTGFFDGTIDFDPGSVVHNLTSVSGVNCFIAKYDPTGNYLWAISLPDLCGTCIGPNQGISITTDANRNIIVTGSFTHIVDFNPGIIVDTIRAIGTRDVFLAKYDPNGNYLWAFNIGSSTSANNSTAGNSVSVDATGNIFITGQFEGKADFNPGVAVDTLKPKGSVDIFLAKYDGNGNYMWAFNLGSNTWASNAGFSTAVDVSGNIVVSGYFSMPIDFDPGPDTMSLWGSGNPSIFVAKYDPNGNYIWAFKIDGQFANNNNQGSAITLDKWGNVFLTQGFEGTVDFNPGLGVDTLKTNVSTNLDFFVAKYDSDGNYRWAFRIGGTYSGRYFVGNSVCTDDYGNVSVIGTFNSGGVDFDPGVDSTLLTLQSGTDIFIAKYDSGANFMYAFNIGNGFSYYNYGYSICSDSIGNIGVTGYFSGSNVDFDPSPTNASILSAVGSNDIFVARYSSNIAGINKYDFANDFEIYPNPSNGIVHVALTKKIEQNVIIKDLLGNVIYETSQNTIDLSNFPNGSYLASVVTDKGFFAKKLIINK